jgi:hypothetical protein
MNRTSVPDKSGQDREETGRTVRLYRCPVSGGVREEEIASGAPCPCGLPAGAHVCQSCEMQYAHDDLLRVEGGFVCRFGCEGRAVRRVDVASRDVSRPADALARRLFGADRADAQRSRTCIRCRHRVGDLADEDEREFALSGLCPRCFDAVTT